MVVDMPESVENDEALATRLYAEWDHGQGTSKSALERRTWNDGRSHGRRFDRFILKHLGINTATQSKQTSRIKDLESQVRSLGRHPVGTEPSDLERQLIQSREACLAALRVWNDPVASFRTGSFSLLFVAGWNSLLLALAIRDGIEWRQLNEDGTPVTTDGEEHSVGTQELLNLTLQGADLHGTRENLTRWIEIRNSVAHRHLPAMDLQVIPYAQAGLLNYEQLLVSEFGEEYNLADHLSVPLQLSGFRNPDGLRSQKAAQAKLPLDVQALLSRAESVPDELLADPTYQLRVAFIPVVPPSGRSPDAVAYFVRPDSVPADLADTIDKLVVLPKVVIPRRPEHPAMYVIDAIEEQIPYRFNSTDHAEAGRFFRIRPPRGEPDQSLDEEYCEYISAVKRYLYNDKWIDRLIGQLSTPEGFREATGREPVIRDTQPTDGPSED